MSSESWQWPKGIIYLPGIKCRYGFCLFYCLCLGQGYQLMGAWRGIWFSCCSAEFQWEDKVMVLWWGCQPLGGRYVWRGGFRMGNESTGFGDVYGWKRYWTWQTGGVSPREQLFIWLQEGVDGWCRTLWIQGVNVCPQMASQKGKTKVVWPSLCIFHFGSFVVGRFIYLFPFSWTSSYVRGINTTEHLLSFTSKAPCYWISWNFLLTMHLFFVAP